jgi:hypothetical protein
MSEAEALKGRPSVLRATPTTSLAAHRAGDRGVSGTAAMGARCVARRPQVVLKQADRLGILPIHSHSHRCMIASSCADAQGA